MMWGSLVLQSAAVTTNSNNHTTKVVWTPVPVPPYRRIKNSDCVSTTDLTISRLTKTMSTQSSKTSRHPSGHSIGMFSAGEARCDRWQEMAHAAQTLVAQSSSGSPSKDTLREVESLLTPLCVLETFHAYPGETLMNGLKEALARSDYSSFSRITNRIAKAIITGSYRRSANAWKLGEEGEKDGNDRLLKDYFDTGDLTKPYFEVLVVSDDPSPEQVRQGRAELRQLRRPADPFVYAAV